MTGRVPNDVHLMREIAAGGQIDDNHVRRHREQPVGEPVAIPRGAGDVKLERQTLHRRQSVNRVAGDVTRRGHGDYTQGTGRASSIRSVASALDDRNLHFVPILALTDQLFEENAGKFVLDPEDGRPTIGAPTWRMAPIAIAQEMRASWFSGERFTRRGSPTLSRWCPQIPRKVRSRS